MPLKTAGPSIANMFEVPQFRFDCPIDEHILMDA